MGEAWCSQGFSLQTAVSSVSMGTSFRLKQGVPSCRTFRTELCWIVLVSPYGTFYQSPQSDKSYPIASCLKRRGIVKRILILGWNAMVKSPKIQSVCDCTILWNRFMVLSATLLRVLPTACLLSFSTTAALTLLSPAAQSQTPTLPEDSVPETQDPADNQDLRPLAQGILSVQGGQRLMGEAGSAVSAQNYDLAVDKLQQARQVFNQLSNFYQDLAASFSGIDVRIADTQRRQAFDTAQMRDEATYQLALVHRAQNKPELAVPLLVQIVRSQNPTRDLGKKAYQQLFELGFVEAPFPREGDVPAPTP